MKWSSSTAAFRAQGDIVAACLGFGVHVCNCLKFVVLLQLRWCKLLLLATLMSPGVIVPQALYKRVDRRSHHLTPNDFTINSGFIASKSVNFRGLRVMRRFAEQFTSIWHLTSTSTSNLKRKFKYPANKRWGDLTTQAMADWGKILLSIVQYSILLHLMFMPRSTERERPHWQEILAWF